MDGLTVEKLEEIIKHFDKKAIITIPSTSSGRFEDADNIVEVSDIFQLTDKNGNTSIVLNI